MSWWLGGTDRLTPTFPNAVPKNIIILVIAIITTGSLKVINHSMLQWSGKLLLKLLIRSLMGHPDTSQQVICARLWGREPINFGVFWGPFLGLWRNSWALGLTVSTHGLCFWADTELMGSSAPKTARILSHGLWVFCQFMNRKVMLQFGIFLAPQVL